MTLLLDLIAAPWPVVVSAGLVLSLATVGAVSLGREAWRAVRWRLVRRAMREPVVRRLERIK